MAVQETGIAGSGYGSAYVDALIEGCRWSGGPVSYWFGSGWYGEERYLGSFMGRSWSEAEMQVFMRAVAQYESVCNIRFVQADEEREADMVWLLPDVNPPQPLIMGAHNMPQGYFDQARGYFWSMRDNVIVHELGHGVGLAHPHDGETTFPAGSGVDQSFWTVMSYNEGLARTSPDFSWGPVQTLMAFDIEALQALYGANMETEKGDSTYKLPAPNSGVAWKCIWDAGGADTISNADSPYRCTIDLRAVDSRDPTTFDAKSWIMEGTVRSGVTIARGAQIENATGGNAADLLIGNALNNTLNGGKGADRMEGGKGDDIYQVDDAGDLVIEQSNEGTDLVYSSVNYTLGDTLEVLWLTGDRAINGTGNAGGNWILGNAADNRLDGGGGVDFMTGFAGNDTYIVDNPLDAVTEIAEGGTDKIFSSVSYTLPNYVENLELTGTAALSATGNSLANELTGNAGNNRIDGGLGTDRLRGNGGADVFVFSSAGSPPGAGRDVILDFNGFEGDRILVSDSRVAVGSYTYRPTGSFSGKAGDAIFTNAVLKIDCNGDRVADVEVTLAGIGSFSQSWLA